MGTRAHLSIDSAMAINTNGHNNKGKPKNLSFLDVDHHSEDEEPQKQEHNDHGHAQRHCLLPIEIYQHIAEGGEAKPKGSFLREVMLGLMAGAFIAFGFSTCMIAAGQSFNTGFMSSAFIALGCSICMLTAGQLSHEYRKAEPGMFNILFGAYGFPVGLSLCVINGASLFTSNIAYMMCAFMEKKATAAQALYIVWLSYFTNFAGCLLLVVLFVSGDVFLHREEFTIELAHKKTSYSFTATMVKGILCNWLVCMAVWQGNAAQDVASKLLGIWFPISAFVTMGFEHCVANMYVIPLAMKLGADISVSTFLIKNLIPATIGNLIGGGFFVATWYGLAYGRWEKEVCHLASKLWVRHAPAAVTPRARSGSSGSKSPYHPMRGPVAETQLPNIRV